MKRRALSDVSVISAAPTLVDLSVPVRTAGVNLDAGVERKEEAETRATI